MYTKQALRNLKVGPADFTAGERRQLDGNGFHIRAGVFNAAECAGMAGEFDRLHAAEGPDKGGHEVHVEPGAPRVSNIFNKTTVYDKCLAIKPFLAASQHLLGEFIIVNSSLWHGGTVNVSGKKRRVLHLTCTRRDLPQQLVQRLYLTEALYKRMSPAQRFLMDIEPIPALEAAQTKSAGAGHTAAGWWA